MSKITNDTGVKGLTAPILYLLRPIYSVIMLAIFHLSAFIVSRSHALGQCNCWCCGASRRCCGM